MPRYKDDPRYIVAKYRGQDRNGQPVRPGDTVLYFPLTRDILTGPAAEKAWSEFQAARQDEETYNGGY